MRAETSTLERMHPADQADIAWGDMAAHDAETLDLTGPELDAAMARPGRAELPTLPERGELHAELLAALGRLADGDAEEQARADALLEAHGDDAPLPLRSYLRIASVIRGGQRRAAALERAVENAEARVSAASAGALGAVSDHDLATAFVERFGVDQVDVRGRYTVTARRRGDSAEWFIWHMGATKRFGCAADAVIVAATLAGVARSAPRHPVDLAQHGGSPAPDGEERQFVAAE